MDIRGQGYDNGSNMKGKHKGVQNRVLEINPRAFYTPYDCHGLNIALCDMANSCSKAHYVFGVVQCIYVLFASYTKRWKVLKDNVHGLTLKPLSQTHWESRIESVKAITYQAPEIRDVLLDVAKMCEDPKTTREVESLARYKMGNFEFLVGMISWHNLLFAVNFVSKVFQADDMHIDIAINQLKGLITFLERYRETRFEEAKIEAKEVANEMEIELSFFHEKCIIRRKKQFVKIVSEEVTQSTVKSFRVNYFIYIVDQVLSSLKIRFEQFQIYEKNFGFLFDVKKLNPINDECLIIECAELEDFFKHDDKYDIDGRDLFLELKVLRDFLPGEIKKPINVVNYLKLLDGCFPNTSIVNRMLLTTRVTVASGERSFLKLKLIKFYLRSTMLQERLNGLAILSIEKYLVDNLEYERLINNFAAKNAIRVMFK